MVGGGSQNKLWRRIVADAFQLPLRFPAEPEAAALGAALQVRCCSLLRSCLCSCWAARMLMICMPAALPLAKVAMPRACSTELWVVVQPAALPPSPSSSQAAAVHTGTPIADFVEAHPPPMGELSWIVCQMLAPAGVDMPPSSRAAAQQGLPLTRAVRYPAHTLLGVPTLAASTSIQVLQSAVFPFHFRLPTPAESGVLQPQHTTAAAYEEAFKRHQRWGACLFGGGSCEV